MLMPVKLSIGQARSNVHARQLRDIEREGTEFMAKFESATDQEAEIMDGFISRLKELSDGLRDLQNNVLTKLNACKERKKKVAMSIIDLRKKFKAIETENIELYIQLEKLKHGKAKLIKVVSVDSMPSFISEPEFTKAVSG